MPRELRRTVATLFAVAALAVHTACGSSPPVPAASEVPSQPGSSAAPDAAYEFKGTYELTYADGFWTRWTAISCGPGCAAIHQHWDEDEGEPSTIAGKARLRGDQWTLEVRRPDAVVCLDGSEHEGLSVWTWDAKTLEGAMDILQSRDDCSDGMAWVPLDPFTLTKTSDEALPAGTGSF